MRVVAHQKRWGSQRSWRFRLLLLCGVVVGIGVLALVLFARAGSDERWVPVGVVDYRPTEDPQRIRLGLGSCNADHRLRLEESATEVRLHVEKLQVDKGNSTDACMDLLNVALSRPLADRRVIDAANGREVVLGS